MRKVLWSVAFLGYAAFAVGCGEPAAKKIEPAAPPAAADGHTHGPGETHDHDHDHDHAHDEKGAAPSAAVPSSATPEPAAPAAGDTVPAPEPAVTDPLAPAAESETPPAPEKAPE